MHSFIRFLGIRKGEGLLLSCLPSHPMFLIQRLDTMQVLQLSSNFESGVLSLENSTRILIRIEKNILEESSLMHIDANVESSFSISRV
jgi:hypothetical protein